MELHKVEFQLNSLKSMLDAVKEQAENESGAFQSGMKAAIDSFEFTVKSFESDVKAERGELNEKVSGGKSFDRPGVLNLSTSLR
jgi:hypothetical protein